MRPLLAFLLSSIPAAALAVSPTTGPSITGTTSVVNNGPGDQTDPHVSGNLVAYTDFGSGAGQIRYQDLSTGADSAIVTSGGTDSLSDVSGNTVVFVHFANSAHAIYAFDTTTGGPAVELDPQPGSNRREAAIGGNTVAWQDFGFSLVSSPEIVAYDRAAGTATRITNDALYDRDPAVSPAGTELAWTKCASVAGGCDIYSATSAGGVWTTHQLTGAGGEESLPDTNGAVVVYGSDRSGDPDIYWQPVAGGAEQQLVLPGLDQNPNISGNLVAFEHYDATAATPNFDIYLYDLASNTLYQLTNTPEDESLNDISVSGNQVRVVFSRRDITGDDNVYAFSFQLAAPPSSCDLSPSALEVCNAPGDRPLLAELGVTRQHGAPFVDFAQFAAVPTAHGVVCIDNHGATSGAVAINREVVAGPSTFKHSATLIAREVALNDHNVAGAVLAGAPGTSYGVRVYGLPAACQSDGSGGDDDGDCDDDHGQGHHGPHGWHHGGASHQHAAAERILAISQVTGVHAAVLDTGTHVIEPRTAQAALTSDETGAQALAGCSSTGGGAMLTALIALSALLFQRRRAEVRVPVRRDDRHH